MTQRRSIKDPQTHIINTLLPLVEKGRSLFYFGSRARGDATKYSDRDIGVTGPGPMSRTMKRNLKEQIYLLPWNIDLVDFAEVDQQFAQEALKDTIEIS